MEVGIITIVLEACFFLKLNISFIFLLRKRPLQTFYQVLVLELFSTYNHVFIHTQSTSKQ